MAIATSTQRLALRGGSLPSISESPLEDAGVRRGMAAPSIDNREDDGVKMSVYANDPLVIGPEGPIRILFERLGQRIAVKGLETFDSVRGLKYLGVGVLHYSRWIAGDNSFRLHQGDGLDDGRDARQNAHDTRNPTKATDGSRRETCGRDKTTSVSLHCWKGTMDPQSST